MIDDPVLRRIERRALLFALLASAVAWLVPGGGWRSAAAVAGGATLIGVSYWAIRRGVSGLTDAIGARAAAGEPPRRGAVWRGVAAMVVRYALLAGMAYVMIARLRLPPIGLLIGASAITAAAALEIASGARRF
jgi:hypothetical protein